MNHRDIGHWQLQYEGDPELLFCDNETNTKRLYNYDDGKTFYKDGINNYIIHNAATINPGQTGTKAALKYDLAIAPRQSITLRLMLGKEAASFTDFDKVFEKRNKEADSFYSSLLHTANNGDTAMIQRQAFAGLLWSKQFYHFNASRWLHGDTGVIAPPQERLSGKNSAWKHVSSQDIISVPDKWEFPWFALWDSAFHCVLMAMVDIDFAKKQLLLFTDTWYMHPNGQLPAYEWDFDDCNPPLHAVAAWVVYSIEKDNNNGRGDTKFLETIFHKLMLNFTWWVNRKDMNGSNIFEGGFLGLDNISVFDRNMQLPGGGRLEQADATGWMAMYSLNLLRIAAELSNYNDVYEKITEKYFEHFLSIAGAIAGMNLWDEEDGFYYDCLRFPDGKSSFLKVRSIVGLIPLFAVEIVENSFTSSP